MFDALYPEQTKNTLEMGPPTRRAPRGLFTGFGSALVDIPGAALFETVRAGGPLLEAFGKAQAITFGGEIPKDIFERDPQIDASFRKEVERFTPDPATTGEASQIVFGVGKVLAKAVPLAVMGGVPLAAAGTGGVEGVSEAQRLGDQGVDPATAAKVGAVRAVTMAAGIALPVAGKTLAQTAALIVAGGPAAFMVEQQAAKLILDNADYAKIAEQYDPFDPVGLAIATLIPGVIGGAAHGLRARRARTEAQRNAPEFTPSPEEQAAARVVQTTEQAQQSALHRPGDVAGAAAHVDALEMAKRQIDNGEPVSVSAVLRQVADEDAARVRAEETPGFLRTADDLVALRQKEHPFLTPEIERAITIARTPGAFRSAEDRIFLKAMLDQEAIPVPKPEPARPVVDAPAKQAEVNALERIQDSPAATKQPDPLEISAREIARVNPELRVVNEVTGKESPVAALLDEVDAAFRQDTREAGVFNAAISCFLRH